MTKQALFFIFLSLTTFVIKAQEITNIRFEQEGKMINIYYDLSGKGTYEIKAYCSEDGGKTWGSSLSQVTGDVGKDQVAGISKKMTWNVLTEREKLQGNIAFKVEAVYFDFSGKSGTLTDSRDGKNYKWVKIGNQVWMAENLNYSSSSGSWCYDDQESNCNIYGRLYDGYSAKTACPAGWHLPSDSEWNALISFLGGKKVAGGKMKETGTTHWDSHNVGANNSSGFTALPGGLRSGSSYSFKSLGDWGCFWSSAKGSGSKAGVWDLIYLSAKVYQGNDIKTAGYSVRCLKDY